MGLARCYKTKVFFTFIMSSGDETTERVRWGNSDHSMVLCVTFSYCISAVKCMLRQLALFDDLQAYLRRVAYAHV